MDTNERKKKVNGVKGRSSNADIQQRIEIGERIIRQHDYKISKKKFLDVYQKKIESTESLTCPSTSTLRKDIITIVNNIQKQKNNFEFEIKETNASNKDQNNLDIGQPIYYSIKQIRLTVDNFETTLYNTNSKTILSPSKKFIGETLHLIKDALGEEIDKSKNKMTHLFIIFNQSGFERYVSQFYKDICKGHILYTSSHEFCSEIVFNCRYTKGILSETYKILTFY